MIAVVVALALMGGLVVLYLTRPYYQPVVVSAARFFTSRDTHEASRRLSLRSLVTSRAFWAQLLVFALILIALVLLQQAIAAPPNAQVGVWVIVDTSASMTTQTASGDRMDRVATEVADLATQLSTLPQDAQACARVFGFDLGVQGVADGLSPAELPAAARLVPRALGTDLGMLGVIFQQATEVLSQPAEAGQCRPTHFVVLTDQPAQDSAMADAPLPVIWRSVAEPTTNYGFINASATGANGFGDLPGVMLEVGAWGTRDQAVLSVRDESGTTVAEELVLFNGQPTRTIRLTLPAPGRYIAQIEPGGAYAPDDQLTFAWTIQPGIRVDWQLPDRRIPDVLGWDVTVDAPRLRVERWAGQPLADNVPTLYVGSGYGGPGTWIDRFARAPGLLDDLNLDVAESVGAVGDVLPDESGLTPLIVDADNRVWFAWSAQPRSVLIPGLPEFSSDPEREAFSAIAFFNAVRWLLQAENSAPLYERTSLSQPVADGIVNALHSGEGDTTLEPISAGTWAELQPTPSPQVNPMWPLWLMLAALGFALERLLALWKGPAWS